MQLVTKVQRISESSMGMLCYVTRGRSRLDLDGLNVNVLERLAVWFCNSLVVIIIIIIIILLSSHDHQFDHSATVGACWVSLCFHNPPNVPSLHALWWSDIICTGDGVVLFAFTQYKLGFRAIWDCSGVTRDPDLH